MEQSKYQPLYLKHRPQALGELVGQSSVVKTLTNAIENKRIAHAYLFTGPRGTGKTSSARILAKSLNCDNGPTVTPCLTCTSCIEVKESSSPSVFEIDAASNNSVDDARMIIERAPLVAQGGKFKLYIVDECHMLTKEAFNALLKTIEEPPPGVIFILATTEEHKVPPTILSRCQRLMFRLVNLDELSVHLKEVAKKENIEIEQEALDLITRRSGGGLRDALGLLDQASLLARPGEPVSQKDLLILLGALDEDVLLTISKGIMERSGKEVLDAITALVMQGREPALIAQELAKHFLNLTKASYITQSSGGGETSRFVLGSTQYLEGLVEQAKSFERVELTQMVETLDELEQSLKRSTQPSMSLEIALLSICHRHDISTVKQLETRINQLEQQIAEGGGVASASQRTQSTPPRPAPAAGPAAGPPGGEVLPHHRQQSPGPEVLPHRQQQGAPEQEVLPHHRQPAAPAQEVLPHHRPAVEQPPVQSYAPQPQQAAPASAPPQNTTVSAEPHAAQPPVASPEPQSAPVQNQMAASEPQSAPVQNQMTSSEPQSAPVQTQTTSAEPQAAQPESSSAQVGDGESFENNDSEEDDGSPDVVVSSVQTLPALPPAPALIYGDDSDEEEEYQHESVSNSGDDGDIPYLQDPAAAAMPGQTSYAQPPQPAVAPPVEPSYSQAPQQASAPPVEPAYSQPPQPAQAPAPAASAPAPADTAQAPANIAPAAAGGGAGELSHGQLEQLWSDLLDALHKRSIPAYSLVSMHAFPVRFESNSLTIGVNREFFQKSIENKTNNLIQAYKDMRNEEIRVVVKVMADAPSPQGDHSAKKSSSSGDSGMATSPPMAQPHVPEVAQRMPQDSGVGRINDDQRGHEMSEPTRVPPTATMARPEPPAPPPAPAPSGERNRPMPHTPPSEAPGQVTTTLMADYVESSKLKEAYKIFEGPGSRLIG